MDTQNNGGNTAAGAAPVDREAMDRMSVAPGGSTAEDDAQGGHPTPHIRDAQDASDNKNLARQPSDEDAKLDVALDETFPTSDAPSNTQPGKGKDPAPSSGYDAAAEQERTHSH